MIILLAETKLELVTIICLAKKCKYAEAWPKYDEARPRSDGLLRDAWSIKNKAIVFIKVVKRFKKNAIPLAITLKEQ